VSAALARELGPVWRKVLDQCAGVEGEGVPGKCPSSRMI